MAKATPPDHDHACPACSRPRKWLRHRLADGRLLPVACGSPNLCDFCRFKETCLWSCMVFQDARGPRPPNFGVALTTAKPDTAPAQIRRTVERVGAFMRSELGTFEYCGHVEFTTGLAARSGGHRRWHEHLLCKLPADVPAAQAVALQAGISRITERLIGAPRVEVAELRTPAGAAGYLTHHHGKTAQLPPPGWTGRRFRPSRRYFDRPAAERRALAQAHVLDEQVVRMVRANMRLDESLDAAGEEEWSDRLTAELDRARAEAAQGVELVRVQQVPAEFGPDGLPSAWELQVLGPEAEMA